MLNLLINFSIKSGPNFFKFKAQSISLKNKKFYFLNDHVFKVNFIGTLMFFKQTYFRLLWTFRRKIKIPR